MRKDPYACLWMPGLMGRRRGGEEKSCDDTNEKTLTVISIRLSGLKSSKKPMDITVSSALLDL